MGADLADVFPRRGRLFREIQGVPHLETAGYGHHLLPDPGEGKVGDKVVRVIARVYRHEVVAHGEHVPVAQEGSFGKGRGPGGVKEEANVVAVSLVDQLLEQIGFLAVQFFAQFLNLVDADQEILGVVPHAFGIVPDDSFHLGAGIPDGEGLVHFLLRLAHEEFCIRVVDDVFDLLHHAVLKEPNSHAAGAKGGHFRPEPFRPIVTDHGHLVSPLETEAHHAQTEILDVFIVVLPGVGKPDAELLLPHGHFLVAVFSALAEKEFRYGEILGNLCVSSVHR